MVFKGWRSLVETLEFRERKKLKGRRIILDIRLVFWS
jgi:hypothetical protein